MAGENKNINLSEKLQVIDKPLYLADSILVLEKELQATKQDDIYKLQVIKNQIQELKKIQQDYLELEKNGITSHTKGELQNLFLKLSIHNTKPSLIGEQIQTIQDTLKQEQNQREDGIDMLGKMTKRDYLEKYIKFDGVLNNVRETEFMTKFYDILTVNCIDYIEKRKNKDKNNDNLKLSDINLDSENGIILIEKEIRELIGKTVEDMLRKQLISKQDNQLINITWPGITPFEISIKEKVIEQKDKIGEEKELEIHKEIQSISNENIDSKVNDICKLIDEYGNYSKTILQVNDTEVKSKLDNLYMKLSVYLDFIFHGIVDKITNDINTGNTKENDIYNRIRAFQQDYSAIKKNLGEDKQYFEIKIDDITNRFIISQIKQLVNKVEVNQVKEGINKFYQFKDNILKSDIVLDKNLLEKDFVQIEEGLVDKLLSIYIPNIGGREDIKHSIEILRKALEKADINQDIMDKIIKKGYSKAFDVELKTPNGKIIMENLTRYGPKRKNIFQDELKDSGIDQKLIKNLFLLSFIESNTNKDVISKGGGAVGPFQILPSTAKTYITPDMLSEINDIIINKRIESKKIGKFLSDKKLNLKKLTRKDLSIYSSEELKNVIKDVNLKEKDIKNIKQINSKDLNNEILKHPIYSAKIAARYISDLLKEENKNNPNSKDQNEIISKALMRYNGGLSLRFKLAIDKNDEGNKSLTTNEIKKTINNIANDLNNIDTSLNTKDMIGKIEKIHDNYYNTKEEGYNFGILDRYHSGEVLTKSEIINWCNLYVKNILDQQYVYDIQFDALNDLYAKTPIYLASN